MAEDINQDEEAMSNVKIEIELVKCDMKNIMDFVTLVTESRFLVYK